LRNFIFHSTKDVSREEILALYNANKQVAAASSLARRLNALGVALAALSSNRSRRRIIHPPGMRLNAIAGLVFSMKTYERVFQPTIVDMQNEYVEAIAQDKKWNARFVRLRGYLSFFAAVLTQLPVYWSRLIVRIWKAAA